MRRTKSTAFLLALLLMAGVAPSESLAQGRAARTSRAETAAQSGTQAKQQKAPAKTRAAKKAELAQRKQEFEEMIVAQEKQAWEEEKKQNADFFRETMTEQFVAAEPDGKRYTKEEVLRLIPTARMTSYELSDFQVIRAGRDAAVLTYRASVTVPSEGKETTTKMLATTVWARRGAVWKMTFHQKTLAP